MLAAVLVAALNGAALNGLLLPVRSAAFASPLEHTSRLVSYRHAAKRVF